MRLFVADAKAAVGWPLWRVDVRGWRERRAALGLRWWQADPERAERRRRVWEYYAAGWRETLVRPREEEDMGGGDGAGAGEGEGGLGGKAGTRDAPGREGEAEEAPIAGLARALENPRSLGVDGVKELVAERVAVLREATAAFSKAYYGALRETEDAAGKPRQAE